MIDWLGLGLGLFLAVAASRRTPIEKDRVAGIMGYFSIIIILRSMDFILPQARHSLPSLAAFSGFTWVCASIRGNAQGRGRMYILATIAEVSIFAYLILGFF
jgi:hypothetical protein